MINLITNLLSKNKAINVSIIELEKNIIAEHIVIATCTSYKHMKHLSENIVKDFLHQNNEVVDLINRIDMLKLKEKIRSPFRKYIKYNVGDSLMIIAYHSLRHLQQAKKVTQSAGFPSA